ncbi:anaerobic ribonucleoside-triphosphate reductase activating protein [Alkaliflexus imshenetskii]|uniref:anaerobic ribonucleoside-triphosphate reductase activating protein n=1 Tax=Alkaliflexus imshenetskii TaxID=286730 RepID=UPI00069331A5|nr:anaerobic ribonucleoside-triphosphate reductase activating protein [Alkaliflexus imshenetskii]
MKIGGFLEQSLLDYPGFMAAVVFAQGCNFRCGYCHNPTLVLPALFCNALPESLIVGFLEKRKSWLDAVVITGGEPTVHPSLPNFLRQVRSLGFRIKLDTNGTNSSMINYLLNNGLVDYIAMDLKGIPGDWAFWQKVVGINLSSKVRLNIEHSINLLINASVVSEFRTTFIPDLHTDEIIQQIKESVSGADRYTVNVFRDGCLVNNALV